MASPLDICVSANFNNLWFIIVLLGLLAINFMLLIFLSFRACSSPKGGNTKDSGLAFHDLSIHEDAGVIKRKKANDGGGGAGDIEAGGNLHVQMLAIQKALLAMERKIENKQVNEVTASYLLHNATDAIGSKVPTAAQVTLEQISTFQSRQVQKIESIEVRMSRMEDMLSKILYKPR